jgi:hypothetical protein
VQAASAASFAKAAEWIAAAVDLLAVVVGAGVAEAQEAADTLVSQGGRSAGSKRALGSWAAVDMRAGAAGSAARADVVLGMRTGRAGVVGDTATRCTRCTAPAEEGTVARLPSKRQRCAQCNGRIELTVAGLRVHGGVRLRDAV